MPTCVVCLDILKEPAALPCGHVFCHECIIRVVRAITPYTTQHFCPTCRHPYSVAHLDPKLVPSHLQHHVSPPIRKLILEYNVAPLSKGAPATTESECERLRVENASIKSACNVWRKRASVHAAATLGFVGLARMARDHALRVTAEKEALQSKYNDLKRKYEETQVLTTLPPLPKSYASDIREAHSRRHSRCSSPACFRPPSPSSSSSEESYYSDCSDCQPALKRQRTASLSHVPAPAPISKVPST